MEKSRIIYSILAIFFGIFMFIYGEIDDSPGGQLIGLMVLAMGILILIKSRKKI